MGRSYYFGTFGGYQFHRPTSGGKAGTGREVTSSIQLIHGNRILKQFRFSTIKPGHLKKVMRRAVKWAGSNPAEGARP